MKHRKLRIAWSVAWGIAAVLLVMGWMRSHWKLDVVGTGNYAVMSNDGVVAFIHDTSAHLPFNLLVAPMDPYYLNRMRFSEVVHEAMGFAISGNAGSRVVIVPYWSLVLVSTVSLPIPFINWSNRFSLRTLLIATTLIAIGLWLIAWATR
jgi:hypothetical protein